MATAGLKDVTEMSLPVVGDAIVCPCLKWRAEMRRPVACLLLAVAFAGGMAEQGHAAAYTFTTVDQPGAPIGTTVLYGINDAGTVVGYSYGLGSFIDTNGSFTTIAVPGSSSTIATAISNNGIVAGSYNAASGVTDFLDINGIFVSFNPSNGFGGNVAGVNNSGQVIGAFSNYSFCAAPATQGFMYANGSSTLINVPGAIATSPEHINDLGQITGRYSNARYFNGCNYNFAGGGFFEDINNVITTSEYPFYSPSIPDVLDVPGATSGSVSVVGVNDEGQIVGNYATGPTNVIGSRDMLHGFVATPTTTVPEPGTLSLLGLSLATFGLCVHHRRSDLPKRRRA